MRREQLQQRVPEQRLVIERTGDEPRDVVEGGVQVQFLGLVQAVGPAVEDEPKDGVVGDAGNGVVAHRVFR
jgi:hypothetical protein